MESVDRCKAAPKSSKTKGRVQSIAAYRPHFTVTMTSAIVRLHEAEPARICLIGQLDSATTAPVQFDDAYHSPVLSPPPTAQLMVERKRLLRPSKVTRLCAHCGTGHTPSWRRGADGERNLCNACGLQFIRRYRRLSREGLPPSLYDGSLRHPIPPLRTKRRNPNNPP